MILSEQETIIRFDEESDIAEVYTASIRVYRLLAARGLEPYKVDRTAKGQSCGWFYQLSKTAVLLKPANRVIRLGGKRKITAIASSGAVGEPSKEVSSYEVHISTH